MRQFAEIESTINEHHPVKIADSLNQAWAAFKRQPGQYIAFLLAIIMINIVLSMIPFLGRLISNLLSPFVVVGFGAFLYEEKVHKDVAFNNFVKPFQKFTNLILTYLITFVSYMIACIPLFAVGGWNFFKQLLQAGKNPYDFHPVMTPELSAGMFATVLLCIIVAILLSFAPFFAYFYSVTPIEAVKLSFRLGSKNFIHIILLIIISIATVILGIIALIVGVLVAIPLIYLLFYFSFAGITKLETGDEPQFDFERQ